MAAGCGHIAAADDRRVAGGIRKISDHSAISRTQCRHESRLMFKTIYWWEWTHRSARAADRRCVPAAVSVVSVARMDRAGYSCAIVDDLWTGRAARRGWLVDGDVRAHRACKCCARAAGVSSDARLRHLRCNFVDRAAAARGCSAKRDGAHFRERNRASRSRAAANFYRRAGCGSSWRAHLQQLAVD